MQIEAALKKFLTQLEADGRSPHTIRQYRRHIRLFGRWWRQDAPRRARIESLDHEDVARFLASPGANTRPDGTAKKATSTNCLRSSLKGFFAYIHRAGYASSDPGRLIRRAVCAPPPPRSLSDDERDRLLAALARAKDPEGQRDCALFRTMLETGVRVGSAVALDVEDVDLERSELRIRTSKGNRPDVVFMPRSIRTQIARYLKGRAGPLFPGRSGVRLTTRHVHRRFKAWLRIAGIRRSLSPHGLRHSFGMKIYAKSHDVLLTMEALRHRSVASTLVYAHVNRKLLRKALA